MGSADLRETGAAEVLLEADERTEYEDFIIVATQ